jgi:hypothetical protein
LLTLDSDQISKLVDDMENETRQIKDEALRISWSMRGGLSYEHALLLSYQERESIGKLLKDNLETTKKTGLPYF